MTFVLGVDGCKGGWCGLAINSDGNDLRPAQPVIYPTFQQVLNTGASVICIDIPIGLLEGPGRRNCDEEARKLLGDRRSCVFSPPTRQVLNQSKLADFMSGVRFKQAERRPLYTLACEVNESVTGSQSAIGRRISQQAFAFSPKIH